MGFSIFADFRANDGVTPAFNAMIKSASAFKNKLSANVNFVNRKMTDLEEKTAKASKVMSSSGRDLLGGGVAAGYGLYKTIDAYGELENAATGLKMTMMNSKGQVSSYFDIISKQSIDLGNKLPGTTADFYNMASALKSLGVSDKAITGGVLKSTAYLGVALARFGVDYQQAATYAAKFKEALHIDEKDMMPFMDLIQRTAYIGVETQQMQEGFSKVSGQMATFGLVGMKAAKDLTPLLAMMVKTGLQGERAGTGLKNVMIGAYNINQKIASMSAKKHISAEDLKSIQIMKTMSFSDSKGNFLGLENMVKQIGTLNKYTMREKMNVIQAVFGSGEDAQIAQIIMTKGIKGLNEIKKQMNDQASLDQKVNVGLKSLTNTTEAVTGTITNMIALLGGSLAPELKSLENHLNDATTKLGNFIGAHPRLIKGLMGVTAGLIAGRIALGGVLWVAGDCVKVVNLLSKAFVWLTGVENMNAIAATTQKIALIGMYTWEGICALGTWNLVAAQGAFNTAIAACPLGAFIVAATAAAVIGGKAGLALYDHWLPFRNMIDSINYGMAKIQGKNQVDLDTNSVKGSKMHKDINGNFVFTATDPKVQDKINRMNAQKSKIEIDITTDKGASVTTKTKSAQGHDLNLSGKNKQ